MEPDETRHHIFTTYDEALKAWASLPEEKQALIAPPRQSHNCWIFDKEPT